ncbi:MAG: hypothetical protein ACTSVU_03010 [Promethearchaeota archaeon]
MAILELYINFNNQNLVDHKFYSVSSKKVLDSKIRDNLLSAVVGLSQNAFNDEIQKFSVGNHEILIIKEDLENLENSDQKIPIRMYSIVEKGTNRKTVLNLMNDTMFQFLNRFSRIDIFSYNKTLFLEFNERLNHIFHQVIDREEWESLTEDDVKEAANSRRINESYQRARSLRDNMGSRFN